MTIVPLIMFRFGSACSALAILIAFSREPSRHLCSDGECSAAGCCSHMITRFVGFIIAQLDAAGSCVFCARVK